MFLFIATMGVYNYDATGRPNEGEVKDEMQERRLHLNVDCFLNLAECASYRKCEPGANARGAFLGRSACRKRAQVAE